MFEKDLYSVLLYTYVILSSVLLAKIYVTIKNHINMILKIIFYVLISLPVVCLVGFRDLTVGADTKNYANIIQTYENQDYGEITFRVLAKLSNKIDTQYPSYTVVFLLYVFITLFILIMIIDILASEISLPLFLFLYYCFFGLNLVDQMRQLAAMSLFFSSVICITKNKRITGVILCIITIMVHKSAFFAILILVLIKVLNISRTIVLKYYNYKITLRPLLFGSLIVGILMILIGYKLLFPIMALIMPTAYSIYFTTRVNIQTVGFGWILDVLPIIILIPISNSSIHKKRDIIDNILYSYAVIGIPLRLIGYLSYFISRISYYNILITLFLLVKKSNKFLQKFVLVIMGIAFFLVNYIYFDLHNVFPYISIFGY